MDRLAKKDQANISESDLMALRRLAKGYAALSPSQVQQLIDDRACRYSNHPSTHRGKNVFMCWRAAPASDQDA